MGGTLSVLENLDDDESFSFVNKLENLKKNTETPNYNNLGVQIMEILNKSIMINPKNGRVVPLEFISNNELLSTQKNTTNLPGIFIYNRDDAIKSAQKLSDGGQEVNAIQKRLLFDMSNEDGFRKLTQIPLNFETLLHDLYIRFPHFSEVIDFISERLYLSLSGSKSKSIRIAPILLRGLPGTGKTYFSQELARCFNLNFIEKDLSITSEAFVIAGMDSGWKNSKPGVVFNSLFENDTANPLICLNEVDKCMDSLGKNSPITTLHWLLEPTSSKNFQDEFIPVNIRADNIIWILTANDGFIPDPILSRLEIFDIKVPSKEQSKLIAQSVWTSLLEKEFPEGHQFPNYLNDIILDEISLISPRIMKKTLTQAAAIAAKNNRHFILLDDFKKSIKRYSENKKSQIGFIE